MSTTVSQQPMLIHSITFVLALWSAAATAPVQAQQPVAQEAQNAWQSNRLFAPTAHQREQEQRGSVVIYDGLKDATIERAMDKAFDRIQNMMFIRIIRTGKDGQPMHGSHGEEVVEDDGC